MIRKTLEKKIDQTLRELEEIEATAIRLNDQLAAQRFIWERKAKKLSNIGYAVEYVFEDIIE